MAYEYPKEIHFIDTSVLVGSIKPDQQESLIEKYLSKVRNGIYKVYVSHLVLGETLSIIFRDIEKFDERYYAISKLISLQGVFSVFVPKIQSYIGVLPEIASLESRCSSTDVRIICEAINSTATKLITFDRRYNTLDLKNRIEVVDLRDLF